MYICTIMVYIVDRIQETMIPVIPVVLGLRRALCLYGLWGPQEPLLMGTGRLEVGHIYKMMEDGLVSRGADRNPTGWLDRPEASWILGGGRQVLGWEQQAKTFQLPSIRTIRF